MCGNVPSTFRNDRVNRRTFLTITGIAYATTILGTAPAGRLAYATALEFFG